MDSGDIQEQVQPKKGKKYFSLKEANSSICYVSRIIEDITTIYNKAVQIRQILERPTQNSNPTQLRDNYESNMNHLNDLIDELQLVGAELKDFEKGLLDFPAVHKGREIYYCWHKGEKRIKCWHEIDAGYTGRQDVSLLEEK